MRKIWLFASVLGLSLAGLAAPDAVRAQTAAPAVNASPDQKPSQFVQGVAEQALNSINGKHLSDAETSERFRALLTQAFDLKAIGRFVLGPYYNSATAEQRDEYQKGFEDMIVDAYALRFRDYSGASFKTGREIPQGKDTLVESQILNGNGAPPIDVSWKVRPEQGGYKIMDVAVEGISMGNTEKAEFASVIERNGGKVQSLIDAMKNHQVGPGNDDNH